MPVLSDGRIVRFRKPTLAVQHLVVVRGPRGPGGGGGGSGVEIQQSSPSSSWVLPVPEEFGRRPNVAIYVAGEQVEADVNATSSTVSVQFPTPTSGSAVLT